MHHDHQAYSMIMASTFFSQILFLLFLLLIPTFTINGASPDSASHLPPTAPSPSPQSGDHFAQSAIYLKGVPRQDGGVDGMSKIGGSGGWSFTWGWGGGGGGGGGGDGLGWGWGWGGGADGGSKGWWKWGCDGGHHGRGHHHHHHHQLLLDRMRVLGLKEVDYRTGEFAECTAHEGKCRGLRLDCPLHCKGPCFYDCRNMCEAHCLQL